MACEELAEPVTYLMNKSISEGIVLDLLKISCITPIYKSGDKSNPSNYRPIALLPSPLTKFLKELYMTN
jgi:hypothetical protein